MAESLTVGIASLAFGLVGLYAAGTFVVKSASSLGARLGLSPLVIGLTIVAAGTSAPEFAVVAQSVAADDTALAIGSIIGSNIANALLVLGCIAVLGAVTLGQRAVRVDMPVMVAASGAFYLLARDGRLDRLDGLLLFSGLIIYVVSTLRSSQTDTAYADEDVAGTVPIAPTLPKDIAFLIGGIAGLALTARFVVSGAETVALSLGIPELIVGLTIVALGTSAPEIMTSLVAAVKGKPTLAVGNAFGSNIFNILLVLGLSSAITSSGLEIASEAVRIDLPIMIAAAVACLMIVVWDRTVSRWEGAVFLNLYLAYVVFLAVSGTSRDVEVPIGLTVATGIVLAALLVVGNVGVRPAAKQR